MNTFPIADGVDVVVMDARFFDVDTTLLLTRGLTRLGKIHTSWCSSST
jgi:hypothetical protein